MHSIIVALAALIASASHDTPDIDLGDQQFFQLYPRQRVSECRMQAWNHLQWLEEHPPLDWNDEDRHAAWKAEANYCYQVWNTLDDVQIYTGYQNYTIALQKLAELRDRLGFPAYYSGMMPDPVPLWHLPRID